jgi:hypothetical protein
VSKIARYVVMGGNPCCEGNVTPAAEYNMWACVVWTIDIARLEESALLRAEHFVHFAKQAPLGR